jgi:hypothetical protein
VPHVTVIKVRRRLGATRDGEESPDFPAWNATACKRVKASKCRPGRLILRVKIGPAEDVLDG